MSSLTAGDLLIIGGNLLCLLIIGVGVLVVLRGQPSKPDDKP